MKLSKKIVRFFKYVLHLRTSRRNSKVAKRLLELIEKYNSPRYYGMRSPNGYMSGLCNFVANLGSENGVSNEELKQFDNFILYNHPTNKYYEEIKLIDFHRSSPYWFKPFDWEARKKYLKTFIL